MIIAIPTDENTPQTNVCISFGRTPYFMFYDSQTQKATFVENSAASSQGGAGIKAAQNIVDSGAGALLTPRCGENAAEVLNAAGIKLYKTADGKAMDNVAAFLEGKLPPLAESHPGLHNH